MSKHELTKDEKRIREALTMGKKTYVVKGDPVMSAKFRDKFAGNKIDFAIFDEASDVDLETSTDNISSEPLIRTACKIAVQILIAVVAVGLALMVMV